MDEQHPGEQKPQQAKPIFLLASSPLVAGGKARLRSGNKVAPKRAKPREVSEIEAHGYTDQLHKRLELEPEPLDADQYKAHVRKRADQAEIAERMQRDRDAKLLSQEERIVKAMNEAKAKRRDVTREMAVLRMMQAKQRPPDKIEKRVQVLEQVVYLGRAA